MSDRIELLEVALDGLDEGFAVVDLTGRVAFWNRAAASITGFASVQVMGRSIPEGLQGLVATSGGPGDEVPFGNEATRTGVVHLRHEQGTDVATMAQMRLLRDSLGQRIGIAISFRPTKGLDALPRGESTDQEQLRESQADIEDRLESAYADFIHHRESFGVLWILVDQADLLRRTHGAQACGGMLDVLERVLAVGLHADEFIGRWGDDEFLIVSHERDAVALASHGFVLAGQARTADFHWWGDRVSITVSIGAAQAEEDELLSQLLERAKKAMHASVRAGGNHVTPARGGDQCLPS